MNKSECRTCLRLSLHCQAVVMLMLKGGMDSFQMLVESSEDLTSALFQGHAPNEVHP